ncbi:hypothetical protein Zm00014a_008481 [Zea mays]|jgi:hypothetical protein|uniref:Uncharacterized protein n=2 Tax=Zea mays TaxID=4577 RepID=A0A1D6NFQ6_MAIZE|nr:hypothetical protein ZEAMMB73_Zm00001d043847 [Zea mays]PWZ34275.1 hypothetical protein Zm00014a_008481 [Zea mays]
MGNTVTVTPRICPAEAGTARGRRPKSFVTEASAAPDAAPRRLTVTPRKQRDGVELERQDKTTRPGPGRPRARAGGLSWAGGVGEDRVEEEGCGGAGGEAERAERAGAQGSDGRAQGRVPGRGLRRRREPEAVPGRVEAQTRSDKGELRRA